MFDKLSNALKAKLDRKGELSRQIAIIKVFDLYKKELDRIFPDGHKTTPVSLKSKILTVKTMSAVMANELRFREKEILEQINSSFKNEAVKRVVYQF